MTMLDLRRLMRVNWSYMRARLCTLAVGFGFNSLWWTPSAAQRFGGLTFGFAFSAASIVVVMPLVLLQLAVGQVSQHDAVGIWRAVPLFRGVGYLRLLINYLTSLYSVTYCVLIAVTIFFEIGSSVSFWECQELSTVKEIFEVIKFLNSNWCKNNIPMSAVVDQYHYYIGASFVGVALWMSLPFMLYSTVKYMRRMFYVMGPSIILLVFTILTFVGERKNLALINKSSDWQNLLSPEFWHVALVQALWVSQVAGGYLISSADTIYSNLNVLRICIEITVINILASWLGLMMWFAMGFTQDQYPQPTLIHQMYYTAEKRQLSKVWSLMLLITLLISGIITTLSQSFPLYDRFRRLLPSSWRLLAVGSSAVGVIVSVALFFVKLNHLQLLENTVTPMLISITTIFEIFALVYVYGWKFLEKDVEFLTCTKLRKCWVVGWCLIPGVIALLMAWWLAEEVTQDYDWRQPPFFTAVVIATSTVAAFIVLVFAVVTIARQEQYGIVAKLMSSVKPSRQWGPRDPITHYNWLARRRVDWACAEHDRYLHHEPAQLGTVDKFKLCIPVSTDPNVNKPQRRSHSIAIIYSIDKSDSTEKVNKHKFENNNRRSRSLDDYHMSYKLDRFFKNTHYI